MPVRQIEQTVRQWLEQIVIGLNLCPFAAPPYRAGRVRFEVSGAGGEEELLIDLHRELERLDQAPPDALETTLLIVPELLSNFEDYNQFLSLADSLLEHFGWDGTYQIASFHPDYRFAGTAGDDPGNLTNRSPYPILHLIREASIAEALERVEHPETIPERNIRTVTTLSAEQKRNCFPYLFGSP